MPTKTVQIPPLSQSRQALMACPALYTEVVIHGKRDPDSIHSLRGTEIHRVLAAYINHLVSTRQPADWDYFDTLREGVRLDALEVLEGLRESYIVEPDQVLGTELLIRLTESFSPAEGTNPKVAIHIHSTDPVAYEMTLDLVKYLSPYKAVIDDFKSYYKVEDADTFQGKLYTLGLFCSNASLMEVTFRLVFVRYGAIREVTYRRADTERLRKQIEAERVRQKALHASVVLDDLVPPAVPGRHCIYCPLLRANACPLKDRNPYSAMTPPERLAYVLWLKAALEENTARLKDEVVENGSVHGKDLNEEPYVAEFRSKSLTSYILEDVAELLRTWDAEHAEGLCGKVTVSLGQLLKAKMRAALKEQLAPHAQVRVVTDFKIGPAREQEMNGEEGGE